MQKTLSNIESLKKGIESSIKSVFDINLSIVMQI